MDIALEEIQLSACVRIELTDFVPVYPCFSQLAISVLKPPSIDFSLSIGSVNLMNLGCLTPLSLTNLVKVAVQAGQRSRTPLH